jgi:hypothetical protein
LLVSHHTSLVAPTAALIVALDNVSRLNCTGIDTRLTKKGNVKFTGTKDEFVAVGLRAQMDEENANDPESPVEEKSEALSVLPAAQLQSKGLSHLQQPSEANSETSSIITSGDEDDQNILSASALEVKRTGPRKLIEDERRATGRISWPVWRMYLDVSLDSLRFVFTHLTPNRHLAVDSGVGSAHATCSV